MTGIPSRRQDLRADAAGAQAPGFDDSGWSSANTPRTWNAVDGADGGNDYYRCACSSPG
ncbi:hypothetical protein [Streptomyces viridochromogenes]|uniref:Putative glycosyl hydrolase n=1 Tax=Streptomyces viridochromogenes Tue57 TaxID=1160705 RepID=L8NZW3_STRVR|nr:hypothetical protein [Streptomyces viridochromogenes]ELS50841.1 putative glycosyl hydrolase [Streptomyces viridochromogenes Tue57]